MKCVQREKPHHSFTGEKWKTMKTNKKYLKADFHNRCAYCDDSDYYHGGYRNFHVDHFAPKKKFPAYEFVYENLLYACPFCNESKSDKWPSETVSISVVEDVGFVNPCSDEYDTHLGRDESGRIFPKTPLGEYMYKTLKLYLQRHEYAHIMDQLCERRSTIKELIESKEKAGEDSSRYKKTLQLIDDQFFKYRELFVADTAE